MIRVSKTWREIIEYIAIALIVLSSGSVFFAIKNLQMTMYMLLAIALIVSIFGRVDKRTFLSNMIVAACVFAAILLNMIVNTEYSEIDNRMVLLSIRIFALVLIQSTISENAFIIKFVRFMVFLAIIGMVCFAFSMVISPELPGIRKEENIMYTFYHTIGAFYVYQRNAGVFWEAPANAIFLNLALSFVIIRSDLFNPKGQRKYIAILVLAIITTLSVYGFVCLAINIVVLIIRSRKQRDEGASKKKSRKRIIVIAIILVVVLVIVELRYRVLTYKLFERGGSYTTRLQDTYYTLYLSSKRIIRGYGVFNNVTTGMLKSFGVINNSNGLAVLLMDIGLPLFGLTVFALVKNLKGLFKTTGLCLVLVVASFFFYHFSEHIWLYTLFISFLFRWKNTNKNESFLIPKADLQ